MSDTTRSLRYAKDGSATAVIKPLPYLVAACDEGHEFCEGSTLHIRARCPTGCPQFQDGSWMSRPFCVQNGNPHPGPSLGEAQAVEAWLEALFAANRVG